MNPRIKIMLIEYSIFRRNIIRFGILSSALPINEIMLRFYDRSVLKQFIKGKPVKFGIKLWALCSFNVYLFDFEIYCEKWIIKMKNYQTVFLEVELL